MCGISTITIQTARAKFPVTETLYGLFFEDINRAGDGGIYPEMIRNRTFEDSLVPEECHATDSANSSFETPTGWRGDFCHGEGLPRWSEENKTPYTPIPGWYEDGAEMFLDEKDVLNPQRRVSLRVDFRDGGRIYNTGFMGVPAVKGRRLRFYMFARASGVGNVTVRLMSGARDKTYAAESFSVGSGSYGRYDGFLEPGCDDKRSCLVIEGTGTFVLHIGFISLMPEDTYLGHGLRQKRLHWIVAGMLLKW